MTMFAEGRNDDFYNEDFVKTADKKFLNGFDWATNEIENMFENLEVYEDDLRYDKNNPDEDDKEGCYCHTIGLYEILEINKGIITSIIADWLERERDMLIASMVDSLDEEEYKLNRKKALEENAKKPEGERKEYYDTRKYRLTGEKVFNEE